MWFYHILVLLQRRDYIPEIIPIHAIAKLLVSFEEVEDDTTQYLILLFDTQCEQVNTHLILELLQCIITWTRFTKS